MNRNVRLDGIPESSGVYVLKLSGGHYYIGHSENMKKRIDDHFHKRGSTWTRLHDVLTVIEIIPGADKIEETNKTLIYMKKYGVDKVRGSRWCQIELRGVPQELEEKYTCYGCGGEDHMINNCQVTKKRKRQYDYTCYRCGRKNHYANDCYARTDVYGNYL